MNSSVHEFSSRRVPTTVAFVLSASLTATPVSWPVPEAARFNSSAPVESYSSFRRSLVPTDQISQVNFEKRISEIYSALASQQISLDREIAVLWDAHLEELYES